jgi:hypothetical protein
VCGRKGQPECDGRIWDRQPRRRIISHETGTTPIGNGGQFGGKVIYNRPYLGARDFRALEMSRSYGIYTRLSLVQQPKALLLLLSLLHSDRVMTLKKLIGKTA